MRLGGMLIHRLGRLRAPVAIGDVEVEGAHPVFAGNALKGDATVHRFS